MVTKEGVNTSITEVITQKFTILYLFGKHIKSFEKPKGIIVVSIYIIHPSTKLTYYSPVKISSLFMFRHIKRRQLYKLITTVIKRAVEACQGV